MNTCIECKELKQIDLFKKGRNICKICYNAQQRECYKNKKSEILENINSQGETNVFLLCSSCKINKPSTEFNKNFLKCKDCNRRINKKFYIKKKNFQLINGYNWNFVKFCNKCKVLKKGIDFPKNSTYCRLCVKIQNKKYYEKHKSEIILKNKQYLLKRQKEGKKCLITSRTCKLCNLSKDIKCFSLKFGIYYNTICGTCIVKKNKEYKYLNPNIYKFWYKNNKTYLLLRTRLKKAFKTGHSKNIKKFLDIDIEIFTEYLKFCCKKLDYKFEKMNWHFDHIIPCKFFKEEQSNICFHWTNIIPLNARLNCSKGATIIIDQIEYSRLYQKEFCKIYNLDYLKETKYYKNFDLIIVEKSNYVKQSFKVTVS